MKEKKEFIILDTTSDRYDEWKKAFIADREYDNLSTDFTEDELWDSFVDDNSVWVEETCDYLNVAVEGIIVAYADLGFWNGRCIGAKRMGRKLNSIIDDCGCDNGKFYTDRYNVKGVLHHHDGTHYLTYRLVTPQKVEDIMRRANWGQLTWEYFRKNSKSIRNYVAEIYGWTK